MKKRGADIIEVWRPADCPGLELRRGFGVARAVPRHWHEEYQFCLVHSGPSQLSYRGESFPTPPSSLFMVHPGEVHSNRVLENEGCSYRTLFVGVGLMRQAALQVLGKPVGLPFFATAVTLDSEITTRYLNVHIAFQEPASALKREYLLFDLLTRLIDRFADVHCSPRRYTREPQAAERARAYLLEHYAENVSLSELARIAHLSPYHFHRVFSEQFGMPPHAFQTQLRVSRAKALLRQGWPISQVAAETGFTDQSHLNRHFKRLVEPTPGKYRLGHRVIEVS